METLITSLRIKEANTEYPVHPLLKKRWSARAFSPEEISEDTLHTLIEAAAWSASSMNEQPWRYLYTSRRNPELFEAFHSCLLAGNQPWAKGANVLLLSLAEKNHQKTGQPNAYALHDVGAANTSLLLQAASMDIYGHMMGGFDRAKTRNLLQIPDHLEIVCFIALGYLASPDSLEEPFRGRELNARTRKPLSEILYKDSLDLGVE